jgi:hypothetical protein
MTEGEVRRPTVLPGSHAAKPVGVEGRPRGEFAWNGLWQFKS